MTSTSRIIYDERLTAPRSWWGISALFGLSMALVFLPYGLTAALVALTVGTCLAGMYVSGQGSTRIRVTSDKARRPGPGGSTRPICGPST